MKFYFPFMFIHIIIFNTLVSLPASYCIVDVRYLQCARSFECGKIVNITYPFWGKDRAEYCGHPDFQLKCQDDSVYIQIQAQSYHVLQMNCSEQTLLLSTANNDSDDCIDIYNSLGFSYSRYFVPSTQNLTYFYNCPLIPELKAGHPFDCSQNTNTTNNYFWIDYKASNPPFPNLQKCQTSYTFPVLPERVAKLSSLQVSKPVFDTPQVLNNGFDVEYIMDVSACRKCESSGGKCGYDSNTTQSTCFCRKGPEKEQCPTKLSSKYKSYVLRNSR
ncbi:non-specific serine/threonine protein kinase [Ranunculus cassubicifolius]